MNKKLISLLLVLTMVFSLLPMAVFAEDSEATFDPVKDAPQGNRKVAVMVYGELISDIAWKPGVSILNMSDQIKAEAQNLLANAKLPEMEMVLVSSEGYEYPLTKNAVPEAAFLSSFSFEAGGLAKWFSIVMGWLQDLWSWLVEDMDTYGNLYAIYGATNVPDGTYTLKVRHIGDTGWKLWRPSSGETVVTVKDKDVNYVGYEKDLGTAELHDPIFDAEIASIHFTMPGVFLRCEKPGFSFTSADLGGNKLPGTEFMLINRDETLKIVKAAMALSKDTFTNAMNLVGTEGFTWDELNAFNYDLINVDLEGQQISINQEQAYKLLETYWMLVEASAKEPIHDFMSDETDIRLPAILKATADQNGIVRFTEDSNCTLTWSIEILFKMAGILNEELQDAELAPDTFENENLQALTEMLLIAVKYAMANGAKFFDEHGDLIISVVNDWLYYLMQNDSIMESGKKIIEWYVGEGNINEHQMSILDLLPTHALLTAKMPAGHYIMLQSGVPEGYIHSPLFYTIDISWNTESADVRDWCYVNVANLGLIGPYFAEDYYTFLRTNSLAAEADKVLALITDGKSGTLIQDTLSGKNDLTAATIVYQARIIYNYMGGNKVYASETELVDALNQHLYAYGRTAQNLMMFGNQVALKAKNVVSCELTPDWTFYSITTSPRTNLALKVKALAEGFAAAIDTTGDNKVTTFVKDQAEKVAEAIDTTNHIVEQTTAIQEQVKTTVTNAVTNAVKTAVNIGINILLKRWH